MEDERLQKRVILGGSATAALPGGFSPVMSATSRERPSLAAYGGASSPRRPLAPSLLRTAASTVAPFLAVSFLAMAEPS